MNKAEELKSRLFKTEVNGLDNITSPQLEKVFSFAEEYKEFLNQNKTERESVKNIIKLLKNNNFKNIEGLKELHPNDKVYYINREKCIYASIIGQKSPEEGLNIIASHLDSPRLDLKPNPLYEVAEIAFFKTHYYGGIKTYQWVNIPLSMHGVIITKDKKIDINIGEKEEDPIFTIPDLLPHLSNRQNQKPLKDAIEAEQLNIIIGTIPYKGEIDEKVKLNILNILNKTYGITEQDFVSAEIEFTPSMKAKDLGFDRSLIASYGQDDKACAYTSIRAFLNQNHPQKTCICILADKEEIGSMGNTGMYSNTFEYFIDKILDKTIGNEPSSKNKTFTNSKILSADVTGAYNPNYPDIYEKNNESYINHGVSIMKYTGAASKGGASDANAEFLGQIRKTFESNNITYQVSEMGKIGIGGGGTISYILANRGMDVLDCGVPVLSMHSPYEVTSKYDIYEAYKAYNIFYKSE